MGRMILHSKGTPQTGVCSTGRIQQCKNYHVRTTQGQYVDMHSLAYRISNTAACQAVSGKGWWCCA